MATTLVTSQQRNETENIIMKTNIIGKAAILSTALGITLGACIMACAPEVTVIGGGHERTRPEPRQDAGPELCVQLDGPSAASDALDNQCGKDAYRVLCAAETLDMPEVILEALGVNGSVSCLEDPETKALTCCANK